LEWATKCVTAQGTKNYRQGDRLIKIEMKPSKGIVECGNSVFGAVYPRRPELIKYKSLAFTYVVVAWCNGHRLYVENRRLLV
jgi:hypothetical protein